MNCTHEQLRCTDGVFYCLKCGAEVPNMYEVYKREWQKEKPVETQKNGRKRKAKKEVET